MRKLVRWALTVTLSLILLPLYGALLARPELGTFSVLRIAVIVLYVWSLNVVWENPRRKR